ncbi:M15 family metallopeptidase [Winogradskyella forsetii]|uniref:M15 family metallopeptidase n=1 Tax=Winogradskyella forsetii TaxID=2686077 RepID=UPI0015B99662|nr:M15 family metallopeptidase [Winogradskyella forsetii]
MKLSEKQQIFTRNIGCLIQYADQLEIGLTFGEAHRTQSQILLNYFGYEVVKGGSLGIKLQKTRRLSKTLFSKHADRLAVDFNFFINGKLVYDFHKVKSLGDYWESLHPDNRWGGDFNKNGIEDGFVDTPHFEMV